ncbi:MAG: hypothetical protein NTU49_01125 [Gammaproteobacteria bacterium]|nr:hypothetical protein [Gammaproteobacteria bacterium]
MNDCAVKKTPSRKFYGRTEYFGFPDGFCYLSGYQEREIQYILEAAENNHLEIFIKVRREDGTQPYKSLVPPEIKIFRENYPKVSRIIIDFSLVILEINALIVNETKVNNTLGYDNGAVVFTRAGDINQRIQAYEQAQMEKIKQTSIKVGFSKNDLESRPSQMGASKSEIIKKELESIALELKPTKLNREILWKQLFERAKNPDSPLMIKDKNTLTERLTKNEWDRSKANRHMNSVVKWYNNL